MSNDFSAEISSRISKQMNDDHADAVILYARVFGGITDA
jgi:putative heme iron utilization protein